MGSTAWATETGQRGILRTDGAYKERHPHKPIVRPFHSQSHLFSSVPQSPAGRAQHDTTMHPPTSLYLALLAVLPLSLADKYRATFTEYGSGDGWGSKSCDTASTACGWYNRHGYNAAISQNKYGVGPGAGAGPACGTCWRLTPKTDISGKRLHGAHEIVVKVNNLCPADGNPLCAQYGMSGTNQYGMLAFDPDPLCKC
jgi:hypothetical protein